MSDWEFLLQKEGDRSWLPLESTDVEILEGRYRIVARSQFPEAEVQIRILHESAEEDPPVRRVQTRTGRTNKEGLIALVPYANFKPGLWEISCEPASMSGLLPEANPQAINLQVLPCESDPVDFSIPPELEETADTGAAPTENFSQIPDEAKNRLPKAESQRVSIPKDIPPKPLITPLQQSDRPSQAPLEKRSYIEAEIPAETAVTPPTLNLILERDSYIAKLGEIFILSGTVGAESEENIPPLVDNALHICLRNPETSEILAEIEELLPEQAPPIIFGCTIAVPEQVKTRLVLGQISLANSTGTIATQYFTIAAPLEQWLEALDRNSSEENRQALLPEATPKQQVLDFPPFIRGAIAPPTPERQADESAAIDSPELPAFGNSMSEPISADGVNLIELLTQQRQSAEPTEPTPDTDDDETEIDSLAEDIWGSGETAGEDVADVTDAIEDFPATVEELEEKESLDSQSDRSTMIPAFQGGKQGDRFLSRLSALVGDSELVEWMKIDSIEPTVETPPEEAVDETSGDEVQEEIDWEAREIVVDDEPVPPIPGTFFSLGGSKQPLSGPGGNLARLSGREELAPTGDLYDSNNSTSGYILPPDEPVPVPEVEILDREVVAGRRVKIRVQLPDLLARIYVKLWISDRQTQTIVDHPRWVTDFSLNGFDKLEAMVEMKVPFGCMEVRFEAIAREMQTNRESHKASIDSQVLPPPPPTLPLEN